jgi:hypothetical protein
VEKQALIPFLTTQIWQVPFLALYLFGLIYTMSGRWQGRFLTYAAWGFGLLLAGLLISATATYLMYARMFEGGGYNSGMARNMALTFAGMLAHLGGLGLLIAAIFSGRKSPPASAT